MTNKFILAGNDSPGNRGCEAITKGTANILFRTFPGVSITDAHFRVGDAMVAKPASADSSVRPIVLPTRWSMRWWMFQLGVRAGGILAEKTLFSTLDDEIKSARAVLSVGGDNYSLDYGLPRRFLTLDRFARKKGKPIIIWGASIGPFSGNPDFERSMADHLKNEVDLIFVREDRSLAYLDSLGVSANVKRVGDPAFVMEPEICSADQIGFNLPKSFITFSTGAMMAKYATNGNEDDWVRCCREIIVNLYKDSGLPVVLVPHVQSDYGFFKTVMKGLADEGVYLLKGDLSAAEMKWVISKSELLIGSRTHATIAGFSTGVPVLSLAYSLKAIGLNQDIFGHTDYLLQESGISSASVREKAGYILNNRKQIRNETLAAAQRQKEMAWQAGIYLKSYLEN